MADQRKCISSLNFAHFLFACNPLYILSLWNVSKLLSLQKIIVWKKLKSSHRPRLLISLSPLGSRWALFARHHNLPSPRAKCIEIVLYLLHHSIVAALLHYILLWSPPYSVGQHGHYFFFTLQILSKHQSVPLSSIMWEACTNTSLPHSHQE